MAEAPRKPAVQSGPASEIAAGVIGSLIVGAVWFFIAGLIGAKFGVQSDTLFRIVQFSGPVLTIVIAIYGTTLELRKATEAKKASEASQKVDAALEKIQGEAPGEDVAKISAQQVAAEVTDAKVTDEHLKRLVEQGKQKLMLDDRNLQDDVQLLIVKHLQPLPRNAKRVLNRLRVSRLIADKRGLFTTEPRVSVRQIGKWLVLGERWPQLGRALAAAPDKMKELEEQAGKPVPSDAAPVASDGSRQRATSRRPQDPFMDSIKVLAPFYVGDEDLRTFFNDQPQLAAVLERLVEYGAAAEHDNPS